MRNISAKCQRLQFLSRNSMALYHVIDKITMLVIGELLNKLMAFCFFDAILDQFISNAVILKRYHKSIDYRIPKTQLIGNVLVEKAKHVFPIHAFRSRSDSKKELRLKVINDFTVCFCSCMVAFIDDDIVPCVLLKELQ